MSDRIATACVDMRSRLEELHDNAEGDEIRELLRDAAGLLKEAQKRDYELRGPTPTDKLAAAVEDADGCLTCGEPTDGAGWCDWECFQAWGEDEEAGA